MIKAAYLGTSVELSELEKDNRDYFAYCASHDFHLQRCGDCGLLRCPPTTGCPYCGAGSAQWVPVDGRGEVHSYAEVHHAVHPAFKAHLPYIVLLVDLDTQRGSPGPHDALRVVGNLTLPDGTLAPPHLVQEVGIGTRVRLVFTDLAPGLSLPQWTVDRAAPQPGTPWRPPDVLIPPNA